MSNGSFANGGESRARAEQCQYELGGRGSALRFKQRDCATPRRIDLLDNHLAADGLDITVFPPMPGKK